MSKIHLTEVSGIKRIEQPTPEEFQRNFVSTRRPVIITGAISGWKALSLWTVDYLNTIVGNTQVDISVSQNRIFSGDIKNGFANLKQKMKFSNFLKLLLLKNNLAEKYYYLQQQSIPAVFLELIQDISFPGYFDKKLSIDPTLWVGYGGNISPLHYDAMDNLFAQVSGRKRFVIFDPQQTSSLYPFPAYSKIPHLSQIDIDRPELERFPNFQKAKPLEFVIEPGELLFLPCFWWHQVYSLDELNISINFWSKAPLRQFLTPPGRRLAAQLPTNLWHAFKEHIPFAKPHLYKSEN